jgi:hypothetical protein
MLDVPTAQHLIEVGSEEPAVAVLGDDHVARLRREAGQDAGVLPVPDEDAARLPVQPI